MEAPHRTGHLGVAPAPEGDDELPFRALGAVMTKAHQLGLITDGQRPTFRSDRRAVILTAADRTSWVAWRDALVDEVTDSQPDAFGRTCERWAVGFLAGIEVHVQDPSVHETPVIGGFEPVKAGA